MSIVDILFSIGRSFRLGNYKDFFCTAAAQATYLQYCIMEPYINEVISITIDFFFFRPKIAVLVCLAIYFVADLLHACLPDDYYFFYMYFIILIWGIFCHFNSHHNEYPEKAGLWWLKIKDLRARGNAGEWNGNILSESSFVFLPYSH